MSPFRRELQRKFTEFSKLGADRDFAVAILNDAIADGEAQAHALADIFGGEERIEYLVQMFGADTHSIVANRERALAILDPARDPNRGLFTFKRFVFESIHRVLEQVNQHMD